MQVLFAIAGLQNCKGRVKVLLNMQTGSIFYNEIELCFPRRVLIRAHDNALKLMWHIMFAIIVYNFFLLTVSSDLNKHLAQILYLCPTFSSVPSRVDVW